MVYSGQMDVVSTDQPKRVRISCGACNQRMDVTDLEPFSKIQCIRCGASILVPKRLGNFMLLSSMGDGGMGEVYRAFDTTLKRPLAVKILHQNLANDPLFVENFTREAHAVAEINHPNIAQFYSFGQEEGQYFLAMELVDHSTLSDLIDSGRKLTETEVIEIGEQVGSALLSAHLHGLVHHDVKPANILFDQQGVAKIIDFGLAQFIPGTKRGGSAGQMAEVWGTPEYIAPEKMEGQRGDLRSDIYSLGATLYHALVGRRPFEGADGNTVAYRRLTETPLSVREIRPDVSKETAAIVARMLARKPEDRYKSYHQLLADLKAAKGIVPRDQGDSLEKNTEDRSTNRWRKVGWIAILVALITGAVWAIISLDLVHNIPILRNLLTWIGSGSER